MQIRRNSFFVLWTSIVLFVILPVRAIAVDYRAPEVRIFEMQKRGKQEMSQSAFFAFEESFEAGGNVATGDVNGDSVPEIIVGAGAGAESVVRIFSSTGIMISEFMVFPDNIRVGMSVGVGDLDGDRKEEIVIGAGKGGGPYVQIFDEMGNKKFTPGFFAFDENFRGGVNVAVGNVDGKGRPEIIAAAGPGGGPQVRIFNRFGEYKGLDFFPFASSDQGGVTVAAANVDGGAEDEIVVAIASFGQPWVKVYKADANKTILGEFLAYNADHRGGVTLASGDIDKDGVEEIITSTRQGGGPVIRVFEGHGEVVQNGFLAYEEDFRGGVSVSAINLDDDSKMEIVAMPMKKIINGRVDLFKYIEVDISEQTLRAYRNGVKEKEFLVSTGIDKYPTPLGETTVTAKIPVKDYEWTYGPEHPDNYDLPDVKYNLRFRPHYYIHYAYWHNNFGKKMSHGCVNVGLENMEWIYAWAEVGTPVIIKE